MLIFLVWQAIIVLSYNKECNEDDKTYISFPVDLLWSRIEDEEDHKSQILKVIHIVFAFNEKRDQNENVHVS